MKKMKISILGLGYVGTVSGVCFAKLGHEVIGIDSNPLKVDFINNGQSPIIEKDIPELISTFNHKKKFWATQDIREAVSNSDVSLICVSTPNNHNGSLDLKNVIKVCQETGQALKRKNASFGGLKKHNAARFYGASYYSNH
jgi:GDP-mannose 6-dehydrogenase